MGLQVKTLSPLTVLLVLLYRAAATARYVLCLTPDWRIDYTIVGLETG